MRILALRGANIASLTDFDIDFRTEPLRSAGLFAIVGPTGSGKSSLLDAMCLALYQKAPRLDDLSLQEGKVETRFGTIAQADIRNLLRRGCDTGFAECDFSGCDGHAYRARWGYRAPKRANAAVQEVLSLVRLDDGQVLVESGGRKGDYQARIEALSGLTYSQFTRTILLAQGRFAEFLRGKENERADLLERLTGTGIYARISMRVRERTSALRLEAEQLEARRRGLSIPGAEEIEDLRTRQEALREELPRTQARREQLRRALEDLERQASLETGLGRIQARCAELEQGGQELRARTEAAQAGLEAAREARRQLQPRIEAARSLDSRREACRAQLSLHGEALDRARTRRESLEDSLRGLHARIAAAKATIEADATWIDRHRAKLEPLASQWPLWRERLQQAAEARRLQEEQSGLLERRRRESSSQDEETAALERELDATSAPRSSTHELTLDLERIRLAVEAHRRLQPWLERREEIGTRSARLAPWLQERQALEARTSDLESRLELASHLHESTRTALLANVVHLRNTLAPGQACPVCGSLEHPWSDAAAAPLDALLEEHARSESTARKQLEEHRARILELTSRIRSEQELLEEAQTRHPALAPSADLLGTLPPGEAAMAALQRGLEELEALGRERLEQLQVAQLRESLVARLQLSRSRSQALQTQVQELALHAERIARDLEAAQESLDAPFGGREWRERWNGNPQFGAQVEESVAKFQQRSRELEELRRELDPLQGRLDSELAHRPSTEAAHQAAEASVQACSRELEELESQRKLLLEGREIAQVEAAQESLEEARRLELEAAQAQAQAQAQEMSRWTGQRERQEEQLRNGAAALDALLRSLCPHGPVDAAGLGQELLALEASLSEQLQIQAGIAHRLSRHEELQGDKRDLDDALGRLRTALSRWQLLDEQIGSADGKKFRLIAQQYTLEVLLEEANTQLESLAPRYTLRMLGQSMHFGVVDHEGFDELRPVQTLSGGETFLVSLALALGLSRLAGGSVAVESLFIDEGFGTLDGQTLRQVMAALSNLHAQGRKVGLITHVEEMKEQIPVQIRVVAQGQGTSRVEVAG